MISPVPPRCPVCESFHFSPTAVEKYRGSVFRIARCTGCGALFTSYREADHNVDYREFDEAAFNRKYLPILQGVRRHDRHENYLEAVAILKKYLPHGRLLDVGCHAGWLLSYLKVENRWELAGLEPSPFLAQLASQRLDVPVIADIVRAGVLEDGRYDGVCLTDVLEHMGNPREAIRVLKKTLTAGGYLLVKVPNADFILWKYRLRRPLGFLLEDENIFDAKEHQVLYTRKTLKMILKANGFRILEIRVPKPIQTGGGSGLTRAARSLVYLLGRMGLFPGQDLLAVAQKI